jgi:hypothetical protein
MSFYIRRKKGPTNRMTLEREYTKIKGIVSRVGSISFLNIRREKGRGSRAVHGEEDREEGGGADKEEDGQGKIRKKDKE